MSDTMTAPGLIEQIEYGIEELTATDELVPGDIDIRMYSQATGEIVIKTIQGVFVDGQTLYVEVE